MAIIFVPQNQIRSIKLKRTWQKISNVPALCNSGVQMDGAQAVGYPFVPLGPGGRETKQSEGLVYGTICGMALVVKCSEILAHSELRNNPRVNKVFTHSLTH